jgi:PAS domain S-box-containing protein
MGDGLDDLREHLRDVADPLGLLVELFAHAPIGLQVYLPDGRCLLTNQAFRDLFGTEPAPEYRLFEDPLLQGTPVLDDARRAFAGERVRTAPIWYETPQQPLTSGGVPRRCAVGATWVPLFDGAGKLSHVVVLFRDVTAEMNAQDALRAERDRVRDTQARLQALLDNAPVVMVVKDLDGRTLLINREASRQFGFDSDRVAGKSASDLFGAEYGSAIEAKDRTVLRERRPVQGIEALPTPEGERRFLITRFPIFDPAREPIAIGAVAMDLSDRLQTEEQLRASESRFRQVFRLLPMGAMFSRVSDRRFLEVNDAWLRLTGFSRQEALGATSVEQGLWNDLSERDELFRQLGERGFVRNFAAHMRTKSGALREVLLSVDNTELDGEACLLVIAYDVTELRQLERELRQSQKMEAIGRLAGGVAHDFNNILTAMSGADALLLDGIPPGDPLRRFAEQIKRSISRAATLTRQLLTFTRKQPLKPTIVDPNEAVRAVVDMLQRMIGADIELRTSLEARGCVQADAGALEQVMLNLAVNARDAMPQGGRLTLRTADVEEAPGVPRGGWVLLDVADTGVGMDAATRARVFEPFFTTKDQGKGTGLGLSTVYGIVEQCGGHIFVDTAPGAGCEFRIYLPRVGAPKTAATAPAPSEAPERGRETVLIAEDDEAVRDFVSLVLTRLGYRVLTAVDGVEALGVAHAHPGRIDLLLSDVVMPRMDGLELAKRLREAHPAAKVIHMTGYAGEATPSQFVKASRLLSKPFEPDDLARAVRHALDEGK